MTIDLLIERASGAITYHEVPLVVRQLADSLGPSRSFGISEMLNFANHSRIFSAQSAARKFSVPSVCEGLQARERLLQ